MKLTVEKTSVFTFDTEDERKRIAECFKPNTETRKHLDKLMDLVEAQNWEGAYQELENEWWAGRDKKQECPRLEFVGLLKADGDVDHWVSYDQLIWWIRNFPERYKVKGECDG